MYDYIYVYFYGCMYVCMYACLYVCLFVCMYVRLYVCMYVWLCVSIYLSIHPLVGMNWNPTQMMGGSRRVLPLIMNRGKSVRSWCVGSSDRSFKLDPFSYFSFQSVLHVWCNKGRGMCYPVFEMMHIKEPLLLIGKSSPCGCSGFPLSLS